MTERHRFRVATYNIHKCRGMDSRVRPERIAAVLREINADVVGLQEVVAVEGAKPEEDQGRYLAEALQMPHMCLGENRRHGAGAYGNVTLSRLPMRGNCNHDITHAGREQRGCLRVDVDVHGDTVHIFNMHLGTGYMERRAQAQRILCPDVLENPDITGPRIVMGDFNEWTRGRVSRLLAQHFESVDLKLFSRYGRSYPGVLPLLHLDHIYYDAELRLEHFALHRSRLALVASDHLPLVADFSLPD